jgi:hypothetical protein
MREVVSFFRVFDYRMEIDLKYRQIGPHHPLKNPLKSGVLRSCLCRVQINSIVGQVDLTIWLDLPQNSLSFNDISRKPKPLDARVMKSVRSTHEGWIPI